MIHYSCDRCRRLIETEVDLRYVVRMEIQTKFGDTQNQDEFGDSDSLLEIERQEDALDPLVDDEVYNRRRFDLCCDCYKEFVRNPLGRETSKPVGFSDN